MSDIISVVKPDGKRFDNIKSVVNRDTIVFDDAKVPLEEGDLIERRLPSGLTETFEVTDRGFYSGLYDTPDHYQARVRKTTTPPPLHQRPVTNIHLTGPNARVNVASTDNSTNIAHSVDATELFAKLANVIKAEIASERDKAMLLAQVEQMRQTAGTTGYTRAYQDFVQLAANWITIAGPFLPALTTLLRGQ
jgi:hypothetical protein